MLTMIKLFISTNNMYKYDELYASLLSSNINKIYNNVDRIKKENNIVRHLQLRKK